MTLAQESQTQERLKQKSAEIETETVRCHGGDEHERSIMDYRSMRGNKSNTEHGTNYDHTA